MNQKSVKFLSAATAAFVAAFVAATASRNSNTAASSVDEPVLEVLQERVNDVQRVVIETQDETLTLERADAGWTLAEKAGYEADATKVRELILAVRDARIIEEKTSNKERFGKLGLDEPGDDESSSKRITLSDDKGEAIASLLIGDQRFSKGGATPNPNVTTPQQQYYVHAGGDAPALLAMGELRVDARAVGWVEQQFLDVPRTRIQAARVTHPDGTLVEAARASMDDNEMVPLITPEGMQPKEFNGTRPLLDALASLRFDDVKKVDDVDWDAHESTIAEIFTEHGIRARVESVEIPNEDAKLDDDGNPLPGQSKIWARFTFDVADAEAKPAVPEPAEEPAEGSAEGEAEEGADGEAEESAETPPEDPAPTAAELAVDVSKWTKATEGWAYAIPSWKSNGLRMKPDALFDPIPEEPMTPELPPELMPAEDVPTSILDDATPPPIVKDEGDGN